MKISRKHYFEIFEILIDFKPSIQVKINFKMKISRKDYFSNFEILIDFKPSIQVKVNIKKKISRNIIFNFSNFEVYQVFSTGKIHF